MRKHRSVALLILFGAMLPVFACNDPSMPPIPTQEDDEEENKNPPGEDGTAFAPFFSAEPFLA